MNNNHSLRRLALLTLAYLGFVFAAFAADPAITVSARQRYPWNGLVDLHFSITGTAGTKYDTSFTAKDMVGNTNIAIRTISKSDGSAVNVAKEQLTPDTYNWVWDAAADLPDGFQCERVTVTATANKNNPLYMVIDLSGGANASSYPVSYLDAVPSGGWSDMYKTTKLVLRRIEPGTFKMCGQYNVTLTRPFYIGVFEVTQKQYELLTGNNPSYFSYMTRPVEQVSYNMIRGSVNGTGWPDTSLVDDTSFIGLLRAKTGIEEFDLPTEAQWEYACRAGTATDYNNGTDNVGGTGQSANMNEVGCYYFNKPDGTAVVGSYQSNSWGLCDMHGNVWEWCLDWRDGVSNSLQDGVMDPKGVSSSNNIGRILRGGSWGGLAYNCTSSYRNYSRDPSSSNYYYGFRLCMTLSE